MPSRQRLQPRRLDAASVAALAAFATLYVVAAVLHRVPPWANLLYSGASLLACVFYTVDKAAARAGRDRICEAMLLWLGLVGGWPGEIVAQQLLRHKTAKRSFRIRFWLSVAGNVALFAWLVLTPHPLARGA